MFCVVLGASVCFDGLSVGNVCCKLVFDVRVRSYVFISVAVHAEAPCGLTPERVPGHTQFLLNAFVSRYPDHLVVLLTCSDDLVEYESGISVHSVAKKLSHAPYE